MGKTNVKRVGSVVGLAAICVCLTMCAPAGMEMVGDAMVDIGETLRDGGEDVGSDAMAQDSCATNCSSAGSARVITADTDAERVVTGSVYFLPGARTIEIAVGPVMVTDLMSAGRSTAPYMELTIQGGGCGVSAESTRVGTAFSSGGVRETGMRLYVPAGSSLCGVSNVSGSTEEGVYFSGYRPYE